MKFQLSHGFFISEYSSEDKDALLLHFKDKDIYDRTLNIPFPYLPADADWWLNKVAQEVLDYGQPVNWAVRDSRGKLVGGIGFTDILDSKGKRSHKAELGYWLAKPFWGKGIMTEAVEKISAHAFDSLGLLRISAHVFFFNQASARVLEKCGFEKEGRFRKFYKKDGVYLDAILFAKVL